MGLRLPYVFEEIPQSRKKRGELALPPRYNLLQTAVGSLGASRRASSRRAQTVQLVTVQSGVVRENATDVAVDQLSYPEARDRQAVEHIGRARGGQHVLRRRSTEQIDLRPAVVEARADVCGQLRAEHNA